ncbi:MAG: ribosome maturation factor RimP [Gammaproteobacteria bacterium]|nr:ribosome maturation factor RimP [Gammaproteobacteria bacterium]
MNVHIKSIIESIITRLGYEFVGTEWFGLGKQRILRVYIDVLKGVTIDDCEQVSHQLEAELAVEWGGSFGTLEVSSPGINRPLFTKEHYQRFIGEQAKIELYQMLLGRRNFIGTLQNVSEEKVKVLTEEGLFELPFSGIKKAHLVRDEGLGFRIKG